MAHPAGQLRRDAGEQRGLLGDGERPAAVFGGLGAGHRAAPELGHELQAVADAQDGHAQVEDGGVRHRARASWLTLDGPPERMRPRRLARLDLLHRRVVRDEFRVHPAFTDTPGDQLSVLPAEVQYQDGSDSISLAIQRTPPRIPPVLPSVSASEGTNTPAP